MGLSKTLPLEQFSKGWKISKRINNRIVSAFNRGSDMELLLGEWLDEEDYRKEDAPERVNFLNVAFKTYDYPVGWHVYTDKEEADWALDHLGRSWADLIMTPVDIDDCVAYGVQSYRPNEVGGDRVFLHVVVCKYIRINHGVAQIVL
jgi:hypothetical protein